MRTRQFVHTLGCPVPEGEAALALDMLTLVHGGPVILCLQTGVSEVILGVRAKLGDWSCSRLWAELRLLPRLYVDVLPPRPQDGAAFADGSL